MKYLPCWEKQIKLFGFFFLLTRPDPNSVDQCIYSCQENLGCSVKFESNNVFAGSFFGSCFPPGFTLGCSGIPDLCQECLQPCQGYPGKKIIHILDENGKMTAELDLPGITQPLLNFQVHLVPPISRIFPRRRTSLSRAPWAPLPAEVRTRAPTPARPTEAAPSRSTPMGSWAATSRAPASPRASEAPAPELRGTARSVWESAIRRLAPETTLIRPRIRSEPRKVFILFDIT